MTANIRLDRKHVWQPGLLRLMVILGGALLLLLGSAGAAHAATIVVNSTADTVAVDSACTLREAIINANNDNTSGSADCTAGSGADAITFGVNGTITLGSALPDITSTLTISGNGTANTIIQANASANTAAYRIIRATSANGNLTLRGVTLRHGGNATASVDGGCVRVDTSGQLTLADSIAESCYGRFGGGVSALGASLTVTNTLVQNSFAMRDGGGIDTQSSAVTITHSTITNNRNINTASNAVGGGITSFDNSSFSLTGSVVSDNSLTSASGGNAGGLYIGGGTAVISKSVITGNSSSPNNAATDGGGVYYTGSGPLTIVNTVVATNTASNKGGGIYAVASGTLSLTNVTVSGNSAPGGGGGLYQTAAGGIANLQNTLLAGNAGGDCTRAGGTVNAQHSLIKDALTCINGTNTNNLSGDPALNADLTLSSASRAINAGDNALIPSGVTTDLAGNARIQQSTVDIGAYESPFETPLCFTEYTGDNTTDFGSTDAQAVRDAVAAASAGGVVKIAGTCTGAVLDSGTTQVARIGKALTLAGGYTTTNWTTSFPVTQPTTLDAAQGGRVIYATAAATVQDLTVQNGKTTATGASGGGIFTSQPITLSNIIVYNNVTTGASTYGGGAFLGGIAQITGTTFISNTATVFGGGAYAVAAMTAVNSRFENNRSSDYGGGLRADSTLNLTNTQFLSNTSSSQGGGAWVLGGVTAVGSRFENNRGTAGGGLRAYATLNLSDTQFVGNVATANSGGGIYLDGTSSAPSRIVNSLFAGNRANSGYALNFQNTGGATVDVVFTTIVSPTLTSGSAIRISAGTVNITGTIISNHATGIVGSGSTVKENYNLFSGVTAPYAGVVSSGGNSITGAAAFVDAANGDYRLTAESQAIDLGTNLGITADFFGNVRPQGIAPDAGFHEFPYTATACGVTNGGSYVLGAEAVEIQVVNKGAIACLTVVSKPGNHPNATAGIQTGRYWQISATDSGDNPVTSGFDVTLIVPVSFTPDVGDKVCRYTGAGVWDCAASSFDATTITRTGVNQFSDWAAGNAVGPTAVTLRSLAVTSAGAPRGAGALLAALLVTLGGGWLRARRGRRFRAAHD